MQYNQDTAVRGVPEHIDSIERMIAMAKKVLVLGATGAMGMYLVPRLAEMGYQVDAVSLDEVTSTDPRIRYIRTNAKDEACITELLRSNYDGIVDFMIYLTAEFRQRHELLLKNTAHYIYLSSYRVYANEEIPVVETSPRLLDVSPDQDFLATEDYSLYKARGENILHASGYKNWTIIRPAITYSLRRLQLTTLELDRLLPRLREKKPILLPAEAMNVQATMSWAGDVAHMISRLLFNEQALCETFSVCTAEHNTWREVAEMYADVCGLKYVEVDTDDYLNLIAPPPANRMPAAYQLLYDRCYSRVMDNSKVLRVTGLSQSELMPLHKGLEREITRTLPLINHPTDWALSERMDAWLSRSK